MRYSTTMTAALTILTLSGLSLLAQDESAGKQPFKPVASIDALMNGQLTHFTAIEQLLSDKKAKDRSKRLALEAEVLAELANVNTLNKDKADYRAWATDLRETALELSREAAKKTDESEPTMKTQVERMKTICTACHDAYQ